MKRTIATLSLILATSAPAFANFASGDAGGYEDARANLSISDERISTGGAMQRVDTVVVQDRFVVTDKVDFSGGADLPGANF